MKSLEDIIRKAVGLDGLFDTKIKDFNKFYHDKKEKLESIRTQYGLISRKQYNEEFMVGVKQIEKLASDEAKKPSSKFIYPGKVAVVLPNGKQYIIQGNISTLQEIYNYCLNNGATPDDLLKIKFEIEKALRIITKVIIDLVIQKKISRITSDFNFTLNSELHNLNVLLDKKLVAVDNDGNTVLPSSISGANDLLNKYYGIVLENQGYINQANNAINNVIRTLDSKKARFETSDEYLAKKAEDEYLKRSRFRK